MELSQLALHFRSKNATSKQVIKAAETLHDVLQDVSRQSNVLNGKLSEYVFFPLSHIFRDSKQLPTRAIEVALQCLNILISSGWRSQISPELGKQLLILLSFLAGGNAVEPKTEGVNEELGYTAFQCLKSLFDATRNAVLGDKGAIEAENIPVLGHAITVVLDGTNHGPSVKVQLAACNTLDSMITGISDEEALKRFFPGIVSSLTKVFQPGSNPTASYKLLQTSLQTLEKILIKVISDESTIPSVQNLQLSKAAISDEQKKTGSWVKATSSQVKLALANTLPLRYHERSEVRMSLFRLCVSILQNCKKSLHQSMAMMAETLIVLCSQENSGDAADRMETAARIILGDTDFLEMLKSSLHDWILALPRIMQSNDDAPKKKAIDRIATGFQLITRQNMNSDILNNAMAFNLRTSVSTAIQASSSQKVLSVSEGNLEVTKLLQSANSSSDMVDFRPILFNEVSQKDTMIGLQTLALHLKNLPMSDKLQQGIVETLRTASGDEQLASFWLSLQLFDNQNFDNHEMDQYLTFPDDPENANTRLLDEVYSFSLDILSKPAFEDDSSWKIQAMALETVALQANQQKQDFRPELVDALYPILERMGSSNAALQLHAMTCLNLVSHACAYSSPSALIVDNADYLVNAVALKLNTFEISPQAPQVLVMMVKLCGPALIPYLDDLVESVFSILACFHGYPRLVESLFAVLHAIVEESAKSPLLAIASPTTQTHLQPIYLPTSIASLAARLEKLNAPTIESSPPHSPTLPPQPPPHSDEDPSSPPHPPQPPPESEDNPPPPTALLNTISLLTQHHLTSPSPPLLLSLLSLLTHAFPPLSPYPTTLLPLLATLFPLLLSRLHDPNPPISIAAADALAAACRAGGDFLASRFEDCWPELLSLYARRERDMRTERKSLGPRGGGVKTRACERLRDLIATVTRYVGVRAAMEDGVFDTLAPWAVEVQDVRDLLEGLNPDRFWLVRERASRNAGEVLRAPEVAGVLLRDVRF